jgi:probable HAF family extracellular repeat protein
MTSRLLKNFSKALLGTVVVAVAISLFTVATATASVSYSVTDLGILPGDTISYAYNINDVGQVVGMSQTSPTGKYDPPPPDHAFLWQNGTMTYLGTISGNSSSRANAIRNDGTVVGSSYTKTLTTTGSYPTKQHTFLWQKNQIVDLGTLGGNYSLYYSAANSINKAGKVVGSSFTSNGYTLYHAVLWQNSTVIDLGTLGGTYSAANSINNAGKVVGDSQTTSSTSHAFLWQNGQMTDLGTLGGSYSAANSINNAGKVVGSSDTNSGTRHAFLWQNGKMTDLGTLGGNYSVANSINNVGKIVGDSSTPSGTTQHAVLWDKGKRRDLNNLLPSNSGWVLNTATAINNRGQIVGYGAHNGQTHAFLLTPRRGTG